MKIWLYFQRYEISENLISSSDEVKDLYAFTMTKEFKQRFESTRYIDAFKRVVMDTTEIPNFEEFLRANHMSQLVELPVQISANDTTTIIGTYKEDSLISALVESYSTYIEDLQCQFFDLAENDCLTQQAIDDLMMLLNYSNEDFASDLNVWHIYYTEFIRSFVSPKIWEQLVEDIY